MPGDGDEATEATAEAEGESEAEGELEALIDLDAAGAPEAEPEAVEAEIPEIQAETLKEV